MRIWMIDFAIRGNYGASWKLWSPARTKERGGPVKLKTAAVALTSDWSSDCEGKEPGIRHACTDRAGAFSIRIVGPPWEIAVSQAAITLGNKDSELVTNPFDKSADIHN
jgi:hypothetical protein